MKTLLTVTAIILSIQLSAQFQWEMATNGITEDLHDIEFVNDSTGIAYSYGTGNIYRTTDEGLHWEIITQTDSIFFEQIQMFKASGWICGEYGRILKTMDYGITWEDISIESENKLLLYGMYFRGVMSGYVSGAEIIDNKSIPKTYVTYNGGNSWHEKLQGFPNMILNLARKDDFLFASGSGFISKFHMINNKTKHVFRDTLRVIGQIRDLKFANDDYGMACSFNGYILTTIDGGESFTFKQITRNRLRSIVYLGEQKWLVAGDNNKNDAAVLYYTNDNWMSWQRNNEFPDIHRIHVTEKHIWIVGKKGLIAKTKRPDR